MIFFVKLLLKKSILLRTNQSFTEIDSQNKPRAVLIKCYLLETGTGMFLF